MQELQDNDNKCLPHAGSLLSTLSLPLMLAVTYYVESEGSNHLDNCRFLPSGLSPIQTLKQAHITNESLSTMQHISKQTIPLSLISL